jgi:tetratricopeptide (TPR) repeat protein
VPVTWQGAIVAQVSGRKDPAAELRGALISALVDVPFMAALPDRRLLINLVRRDVENFPDVQERSEARLHVVEIVLACLNHPGGLRALNAALVTMSPESAGTKRAAQLIESATLLSLTPDAEVRRIHELLRKAEDSLDTPQAWRALFDESPHPIPAEARTLVAAFDHLARRSGRFRVPPAFLLINAVADSLEGSISIELVSWAEEQAHRLDVLDDYQSVRHRQDAPGVALMAADDQPNGPIEIPGVESTDELSLNAATISLPDVIQSDLAAHDESSGHDPTAIEDPVPPGIDASSHRGDGMPPGAPAASLVDTLPKVWGDVPQRNPNFTGRSALLEQLHAELSVSRQTAVLPQALHGMGGVGKSQVAIEYVHRHSADYDLVWWISAEQTGQILASLTKLAQRLDLDVGPEVNTAVPIVREALSTGAVPYERWLLVFDNAETPDEVRQYFPTGGAGKILVTSRDVDWSRVTQAIEVDVFTREESCTFLRNRNPELSQEDADRLAEALGDLPLAIEQAAAWRAATGMPVNEYLTLLEEKRIELLDASPSPDYRRSVAAAWKVSLDRLREVNGAALQLLQICSFFAPEPISRELFAGSPLAPITPELDATLADRFWLNRAIRDIQRYALARIDHRNNTLQIHRLVQAVLVGGLTDEERVIMRRGAHTLLANSNPNNPSRRDQWSRYQALRPHVSVSRAVESSDPRVQDLVYGIAQFLYFWGDHTGSEELIREAYEYRVQDRGEADQHTLTVAKWLGWMLWNNGKYDEAKHLNLRTLELYRATFGETDDGTLDAMYVVAGDRRTSGDFKGAQELDDQGFDEAKRVFGEDDPVTLNFAHSRAVDLRLLGEYKKAAELDADTHRRSEVVLGSENMNTLNSLNAWTIDLRESGNYLEARRHQEDVYVQHVNVFGLDAPATLRAARTLAVARRKAGDHPGARRLSEETLEKYRRRYDDDYPDTIATALNYAIDLRHAGRLEESWKLGEATADRYERKFGARHSYTLSARTNLAIVLRLMSDVQKACDMDWSSLDLLEQTLGSDHAVTLSCATNLASDLYSLGDYQAAYERDTDTLARSERTLGVEHPSTLACSVNLAMDLRALSRINEADKMLADTMLRFRRVLGEKHPATLNALQSLRADCDVDPMPI